MRHFSLLVRFLFPVLAGLALSPPITAAARDAVTTPEPPERPKELRSDTEHPKKQEQAKPASKEVFGPPLPLPPITAMPPPVSVAGVCAEALKKLGATFETAEAPKASNAECRVEEPVHLATIIVARKGGTETVTLVGRPLLSCSMALAVTAWVQDAVAPLARGHFDAPLTELSVGGGFECRQRNHQAGAPRSEHSYARALDIMSFKIGTRVIKVEKTPPADAGAFIKAVHASGCGAFSTALGPEADAAHENHIHVDMQPRRSPSSKFCE